MTIPSGAPIVVLPVGTPTFQINPGVMIAIVGEVDPMEPPATVIKIAQQDTDSSWKLVFQLSLSGISQFDTGTALATVFNYSSVAQKTSWTAADALALAQATPPATLEPLVRSWMLGVLAPQIAAEILSLYPATGGTPVTPPASGNTTDLLDLVKQFLLGITVARNADGSVAVGHH